MSEDEDHSTTPTPSSTKREETPTKEEPPSPSPPEPSRSKTEPTYPTPQAAPSSPQASSSNMPHLGQFPTPQTSEEIATHLETFVREFLNAINTRSLNPLHPLVTYLSPSLVFDHDYGPCTTTRKAYLETAARVLANSPQQHMHLSYVKANNINLKAGYADVHAKKLVTGIPRVGFRGTTVSVFEFRKGTNGRWMCVKITGIRGMPDNGPGVLTPSVESAPGL